MDENFKDRVSSIWQTFFLILIVSYIFWYLGGGPERWDSKFDKIIKEKKGLPILMEDPFEKALKENKL